MVRFSSNVGCYAISYVHAGEVKHLLVQKNVLTGKWELSTEKGKGYATVQELVKATSVILKIPFNGLNPISKISSTIFKWNQENIRPPTWKLLLDSK
jgi:hypothetical protein